MNDQLATTRQRVRSFETSAGGRIFQVPVQAFPILSGYVYVILVDFGGKEDRVLIDSGSGYGPSNQHLEDGFESISAVLGEPIRLADLTHILITHGHIDHIGGLTHVRPRTEALLGVHELDRRNLTNYEQRVAVAAGRLETYLVEAGVAQEDRGQMLDMYNMTKSLFHSQPVDFTYEAAGMSLGPFEMLHVPGHSAGHVVIRLHDVLFSGDHILDDVSPHQSPERLTLSTGLEHYLRSLDKVETWAEGVQLILGGHGEPIKDLVARIENIRELHKERLAEVMELLSEAHTVSQVAGALFGEVHGYNVLLAIEEAGAHVEYLYQRGLLEIANFGEWERYVGHVPIQYHRAPGVG